MTNHTYTIHPVASLFPEMSEKEYCELKESISKHGQFQPIVVDDNQLLDGRHRLRACVELGIEPQVQQFPELRFKADPATWVFTTNARRRNLTPDQKLAVLSAYDTWRQTMGSKSASPTQAQSGGDQTDSATSEDDQNPTASGEDEFQGRNRPDNSKPKRSRGRPAGTGKGRKREQLATAADQSQYRARQMLKLREHTPDLAIKVEAGDVSLKDAIRQLKHRLRGKQQDGGPAQAKSRPETAWKRLHQTLEKVRVAWPTDKQDDLHQRLCEYLKTAWPLKPVVP